MVKAGVGWASVLSIHGRYLRKVFAEVLLRVLAKGFRTAVLRGAP